MFFFFLIIIYMNYFEMLFLFLSCKKLYEKNYKRKQENVSCFAYNF